MKKVLINVEERELRVAILEDEQLVELYIESLDEKSILNNIYKGRVEDVLPGLKAAFVNIGLDRNAFLHFDDVRPDLIWAKYREMNPEMADEVPTAREALAEAAAEPAEGDGDETAEGKRKRRRGRRGGKKRRPDAEDTYSPGLPVGVTEDDLEDEEEDETEIVEISARPLAAHAASAQHAEEIEEDQDIDEIEPSAEYGAPSLVATEAVPSQDFSRPYERPAGGAPSEEELERRKQARIEKQRQRRERWEQKKLERQQRRQQERAERVERGPQQQLEAEPSYNQPAPAPTAYGTRGAAHSIDTYTFNVGGNQRRNQKQRYADKARYGDNFGNIAIRSHQRVDHRDSQVDFFGPTVHSTEEQHSVWDDRQPNLGPVPGSGKPVFDDEFIRPNRGNERYGSDRRPSGQQQNRPKKFNKDNKRRGGKKRNTMRKRDNRSYFALSADDLPDPDSSPLDSAAEDVSTSKKPARKRKPAAEPVSAAEKKKTPAKAPAKSKSADTKTSDTVKAPARKKKSADETEITAAPAATKKKKSPQAEPAKPAPVTQELDLQFEEQAAPKKPARARKPAAPRTKKSAEAKPGTGTSKPSASEVAAISEAISAPETARVEEPTPVPEPVSTTQTEQAEIVQPSVSAAELNQTESISGTQQVDGGAPQRRIRETRAQRFARIRKEKAAAKAQARALAAETQSADQEPAVATEQAPAPVVASQAPAAVVPVESARQQYQQQQQTRGVRREHRQKMRRPQFQEVFKKGDEIMVQVVKEEIGLKGARISSYVSLPGRYLVLLPYPNQEGGISRKVEDIKERKRLKSLLHDISSDETAFIIRTAGIFQEEKEIRNDVEFLSHEWSSIADRYKQAGASALVYDDHDIVYRLARDVFDDSVTEIQIDSHTECEKLKDILGKLIPSLVDKVKLYSGSENIFQKFGVTKQIQKAARRKVWLKSGGYLIIDEAEALTAIDVNTGKSVGKDDQEKLILRTNLESARAVARELKLRDIGGLIVIDFIDMKDPRNREQVLHELKLQLRKDRSKTSVSAISEFGLVEMTRKRVRRSLRKTLFMDCPYCQGAGVVLNEQQIWLHIKHDIIRQLDSQRPSPSLNITVNPRIRAYIDQNYRDVIRRLEQKYDTEIRISMSDIFHIENYQIDKADTGVISGSATMPTR